jgi:hypothetical protein
MAVDEKPRFAVTGHDAINALEAELPRPLDAVDRHASVPGVAEIDRAAGMHANVIGAVEFLSLKMRGQHFAPAIGTLANKRGGRMFADDQVQLGVVGHTVAFVRRAPHLDDAAPGIESTAHIAGHVRKQQMVIEGMPHRPLGELEAGAGLTDRRVGIDEVFKFAA